MSSIAELVQRTAVRLQEGGIKADLDRVVELVVAAADLPDALNIARRLLPDRIKAVEAARTELWELSKKIAHLRVILPYTAEGWPLERDRLNSLVETHPAAAVAAWLRYWFSAASANRLAALKWLVAEAALPKGAELLAERAAPATHGLEERNWHLAAPLLLAGATGLAIDGNQVPEPDVQVMLRLLLARLAIVTGNLPESERALKMGVNLDGNAAALALQARSHHLMGNPEAARSLLVRAQDADPGNLDVVVELIRKAREGQEVGAALDAAQVGVDALQSLLDADSELRLLLEPPAELWVAVADRARREGMLQLASRALDEAEALTAWEEQELSAVIAERRADGLVPGPERLQTLISAGNKRVGAGQIERGRLNFERALEEGGNGQERRLLASAAIRLADCIMVINSSRPLRLVRDEVSGALQRLITARAVDDLAVSHSWNYVTEVELRLNLARAADADRVGHLWGAFLAATRGVALSPSEPGRWSALANVAQSLYCFQAGEVFARWAVELGGTESVSAHVQALANLGDVDAALELLGESTDPWNECIRSYLFLRLGKPEDAVRLLRAVTVDPSWTWVHQTLVSALLVTGRFEEAVSESETFTRALADRAEEWSALGVLAHFAQVQGQFDRAAHLAEFMLRADAGVEEGEASTALGQALLLRGESDRGLRLMEDALSSYRSRALDDWSRLDRPQLEALASWRNIPVADLDVLNPAVARRRQQLQEQSDPVAELAATPAGAVDPLVVTGARSLGSALLRLVQGDEAGAEVALTDVGSGLAEEVRALRAHLHDLADRRRRDSTAAEAIELSSGGDRARAASLLARLIDEVPYEVDNLLRQQATDVQLAAVAGVLRELAGDPVHGPGATNVLRWLGFPEPDVPGDAPPAAGLQLELPPSWFEDHPDPVQDHALFLRYLPELRLRVTPEVPAVRVSTDDGLEPDGYRVLSQGELAGEGRVDAAARYCHSDTLALLPSGLRSLATPHPDLGGYWLPADAVLEEGGLAELLTMPAIEVVARLLGDIGTGLAQRNA